MTTPRLAPRVDALVGSVYSNLVARFAGLSGERYPFHVGDTWLEPPEGCRTEDVRLSDWPGHHRYTPVPGLPALLSAVAARVAQRTGVPVAPDEVFVCAGATAGFAQVLGAVVPPGGEVLVLGPAWPLFAGGTVAFEGVPVHVPFHGRVARADEVDAALDPYRSPAAVAVYLNTPSNPTGRIVRPEVVAAVAAWARRHGLWLISDEVYEDIRFVDVPHVYARSLAAERAISAWSFSKAYGMAGNRVGYVVGPRSVIAAATKLATYTSYCAPHVGQLAALRALGPAGDAWVADATRRYAAIGRWCAERHGVDPPEGGTFLFLDLDRLGVRDDTEAFLARCVDVGVLLAPGRVFGPPWERWVRLCFTAVPPEVTQRGVEALAGLLPGR